MFLAPEQLAKPEVLDELAIAHPSLFVVDEAHGISEWGHDFRPDYLRLGAAIDALGHPAVLALTATAAPPVRDEIVERLRLRDPAVFIRGFDRPNIRLSVQRHHDEKRKLHALREHVAAAPPPGIVYVATRRGAEELAADLRADGLRAEAYHAGMRGADRSATQERFMADELDAIVATTAFGMGVDKPNVRWVVHAEVSESRGRVLPGARTRRPRRAAGGGGALLPRAGSRPAPVLRRRRAGRPGRDRRGARGRRATPGRRSRRPRWRPRRR